MTGNRYTKEWATRRRLKRAKAMLAKAEHDAREADAVDHAKHELVGRLRGRVEQLESALAGLKGGE